MPENLTEQSIQVEPSQVATIQQVVDAVGQKILDKEQHDKNQENAKKLNLIDKIGGLYAAINEAKKLSGIKEDMGLSIYPKKPTLTSLIMSYLGGGSGMITSPSFL